MFTIDHFKEALSPSSSFELVFVVALHGATVLSAGAYSCLVQLIRRNVLVKIPGGARCHVVGCSSKLHRTEKKQIIHKGRSFTTGRNERENAHVFCRRGNRFLVKMEMNNKQNNSWYWILPQLVAMYSFYPHFYCKWKWKKGVVALTSFHGSGIMPWLLQDEAFLWRRLEVFARPGVRQKGKHWYTAYQFSPPPPALSLNVTLSLCFPWPLILDI